MNCCCLPPGLSYGWAHQHIDAALASAGLLSGMLLGHAGKPPAKSAFVCNIFRFQQMLVFSSLQWSASMQSRTSLLQVVGKGDPKGHYLAGLQSLGARTKGDGFICGCRRGAPFFGACHNYFEEAHFGKLRVGFADVLFDKKTCGLGDLSIYFHLFSSIFI